MPHWSSEDGSLAGRCAAVGIAKILLVIINVGSFAVAAGMVGVGARKSTGTMRKFAASDGSTMVLLDPFVTLIALGSLLMPLSLTGAWAALRGSKKLLFAYFWTVLCFATGLIYLAILCSVYASSNAAVNSLVSQYWGIVQEGLQLEASFYDTAGAQAAASKASGLLDSAAGLGSAAAALLFVSMFCASTITGHDWMLSRVGLAMNVMSAVLAAAVLYLATVISTGHVGGDWAPKMLQALGAITMVESIVGICSLVLRWRWILWVHCVTISLMFVLVLTATCACLVYGTSKVSEVAAGSSDVILQHVLGCSKPGNATLPGGPPGAFAVPAPSGANATLSSADAMNVLKCAVGNKAQQSFSETNMLYIGALAVMLLVMLLFNAIACWYLLWLARKEHERKYGHLKEAELAKAGNSKGVGGDLEAAGGGGGRGAAGAPAPAGAAESSSGVRQRAPGGEGGSSGWGTTS